MIREGEQLSLAKEEEGDGDGLYVCKLRGLSGNFELKRIRKVDWGC